MEVHYGMKVPNYTFFFNHKMSLNEMVCFTLSNCRKKFGKIKYQNQSYQSHHILGLAYIGAQGTKYKTSYFNVSLVLLGIS